uniref:Uncharacterized protein n=1 Tax=Polyblepharides amylifera TaxID=1486889 RepID=A0A7R9SV42_9CHLO|mmetsp:Transcript_1280/g.1825  ORF Transcript_1280/g.1825 Transcript_1280/m.1825 type:complete len:100 (+) Transcript_1280:280-579(+)|eukprot:CAMPEP_0196579982 /NCGR_PEP_ID=MMETSP1081-20130531/26110_1 /TAXON_ID=36882 /ORGANISM="Pyramimonas amylifera, Strain CCMP720" /LENGTH=99 /DNA_ID=CAMNT_0041899723 /DNA_START=277 /DNA_END=576 /DNA_ORIENTATION=+
MEEGGPENIQDLAAEEENIIFDLDNRNNNNNELAAEHQYECAVLSLPPRVVKLSRTHLSIPPVYLKYVLGEFARVVSDLMVERPTGNPPCTQPPYEKPE